MKHSPRFLKLVADAKTRIREISIEDLKARLEAEHPFILIDVREESEWKAGRLPKAIHLGKGILERDIEAVVPETNQELVLYCGGGYRSALAADALQKMGYTQVYSLDGGFRAWKESSGTIVQSS